MPIAGVIDKAAIGYAAFNLFQPHPVEVIKELLVGIDPETFQRFFGRGRAHDAALAAIAARIRLPISTKSSCKAPAFDTATS